MATTTTDDGFHEIQLNGKQLVFLFMALTVVSVVIFLCGVLVGRGVRTEPAATEVAAQKTGASVSEPALPPSVATGSAPSASAHEELSYQGRLASAAPAREDLRPASLPAPSAPVQAPPTPGPAPVAAAPPRAAAVPASPAQRPVAAEPAGAGFAIQLAALGKRDEADGIARRLTRKGYSAYVLTPDAGAPAVFRVRVGKFKERREAESVAARLHKEEQFNPWIVR